ncbi:hypothetical protein OHT93_26460 [Streptomyces sp. NBC_00191]|uniref:hypothetical protein n=1 Tax=Streptomyces sp. NBC_00191 TaxID=2975674 RepID=UPI003255FA79
MTRQEFAQDFGFSALTKRFHGPWDHERTALETVADGATDRVDEPPGSAALALLEDTLRLLESPLSSGAITTLWLAATGRGYSLDRFGVDGRDWLRQIVDICTERLRQVDPAHAATIPGPASDELTRAVMEEIRVAAPVLTAKTESRRGYEVEGVVPALEQVVTEVDPDLGFRLFLRIMNASWVPITEAQYARYETLGERFGYGRFHVDDVEFLTQLKE